MNRFFDPENAIRELPCRVFARLDDLEPIGAGPSDDLTFILDAVDADWSGFGESVFDLGAPNLKARLTAHWRKGSGGALAGDIDPYERVPIFRIEISVRRGPRLFEELPRDEERWISLELSFAPVGPPIDVYGGLFAPPMRAYLHAPPGPAPSGPLTTIFDMVTWPDASQQDLLRVLRSPQCDLEALVCFDIGQGAANALLCSCGAPIYYFDTGRGSGRNAPTAPPRVDFCTCAHPTVILSHWDTDHWAGAAGHRGLLACNWVVPRQTISTTHTAFANAILAAGGRIFIVGYGAPPLSWNNGRQDFDLRRAQGSGRNGTGLGLIVTDRPSGRSWVLTGDAAYHQLPHPAPADVAAMVVPHHGADMGPKSLPHRPGPSGYARLMYSFGPNNTHGPKQPPVQHPVAAALSVHNAAGWNHGTWAANSPGNSLAGGDVLATATHTLTHLDGAAAGWTGPPALGHLAACPNALSVTQF